MKRKIYAPGSPGRMPILLLLSLMNFIFFCSAVQAQVVKKDKRVSGTVVNVATGAPVIGAAIRPKGFKGGTTTDSLGIFNLSLNANTNILIVSSVGYKEMEAEINTNGVMAIKMVATAQDLNDVVVVAYGTQKKISMVSSIVSITPKEIKGPTGNLTTMLAGRISGLISYQRSGEPGADNAQFFIRGVGTFGAGKVNPLILIDGIESDPNLLARMQPDDIAGFSILKDATASALYGARGANGVILVTTKTGQSGKIKFNVRVENSSSANTQNFALADNITYMTLANEAVLTRDPLGSMP